MVHTVTLSPQKIPAEFDYWSHQCNFPNGAHIEKGDKLVSISFYKEDGVSNHYWDDKPLICSVDILADYEGYVYCQDGTSHHGGSRPYSSKIEDKVFLEIYSSLDDLCTSIYGTSYEIVSDEFSSERTIRWRIVAGVALREHPYTGFLINNENIILCLTVSSGRPILRFVIKKGVMAVRKRDTISFRFDDNSVRSFPILESPGKIKAFYTDYCFVNLRLSKEDIIAFAEKGWDLIRIEHFNGDAPHTIGNERSRTTYQFPFSATLFKRYTAKYIQALNEIGVELTELSSTPEKRGTKQDLSDSDVCFVYLMKDTTNGFHKIGISNHPEYRERTLQSEKPTIELLAAKPFPSRIIAEAIEQALHKAFGEKRLRGEWFELTPSEVNDIIQTLK